jgi:hypothetical protein
MKTTIVRTVLALAILALSGCATGYKLPLVEGESMTYSRTDPLGGTQIEATEVKVTEKEVTAETASWNTTYPAFTVKLTVKGYKRQRDAEDK